MQSAKAGVAGRLKRELQLLVRALRESSHDHAKDLSAAIAFWAFFSIFPLLIGILSLAGYFLESDDLKTRIFQVVSDLFPGSANLVKDNVQAVVQNRGALSWVGIGGLLWSAAKVFGAITRAVNLALEAERPHHVLLSRVRYFFMAIVVSVLTIASIAMTVIFEIILDAPFLARLGIVAPDLPRVQGWITNFALVFLIFALIYKLAPYIKVKWREVLPGALLAAVLFELVKAAFVLYLDRIANFEAVYGSLASIIVTMMWLYLSALILIYGAEYSIVRAEAKAKPEGAVSSNSE